MEAYTPSKIEKKWQKVWQEKGLYQAADQPPSAFRQLSSQSPLSSRISDFTEEGDQKGEGGKDEGRRRSDGGIKPKFYALVEFPYPSGAGLHVGHVRAWSAMDAYARKKRMEGYNVLFPMGWDAFGLPAENYAIKKGVHPSITTTENIANFKRQIQSLGLSFDWSCEINTTDPKYYKWTQWIFLKLLEHGLAYQKEVPVNWCPSCRTNLADEEVLPDGTHERCGKLTEKRMQKQWLLAITKYADRLIEDLKKVDFPSKVAVQQVNWIGRKEGINITYDIDGLDEKVTVFTTRPDTNFGATFIVLSPEHPLVAKLLSSNHRHAEPSLRHPDVHDLSRHPEGLTTPKDLNNIDPSLRTAQDDDRAGNLEEVRKYVEAAKKKTDEERIAEGRKKTGVFTGLYAINHLTGDKMPIWVSDFVLMSFGTGAVVGVPGHDLRDFEFAKEFGLKVVRVVVGKDGDTSEITKPEQIQEEEGKMINSGFLNGLDIHEATSKIMDYLEEKGWGKRVVNYHLHDWIFSRQHYWGEPIPVVYCENCAKTQQEARNPNIETLNKSQTLNHNDPNVSNLEHLNLEFVSDLGFRNSDLKREGSDLLVTEINGKKYAVVPVPEKDLPVELPYVEKYEPSGTGESPLSTMTDWVNTKCPKCGGKASRETDTMPNWAGSNWYYLGYLFADKLGNQNNPPHCHSGLPPAAPDAQHLRAGDPESRSLDASSRAGMTNNVSDFDIRDSNFKDIFTANKNILDYWMPVDVYEGGYEHTTLHLLYSRFIYKFLFDIGLVPGPEPYAARRVHGIVLGPDNRKMSKSFGNVLNPDEIVEKFGADTLRMYEMFIGPFAETVTWNMNGVAGVYRFLGRVYSLFTRSLLDKETPSGNSRVKVLLSKLAKKVSSDIDSMKFNTAVSSLMEFTNEVSILNSQLSIDERDIFLRILAPMAPHLAEELYQRLRSDVVSSPISRHPEVFVPKDPRLLAPERSDGGQVNSRDASGTDTLSMTKERTPPWPTGTGRQNDESFVSIHSQSWPKIEVEESVEDASVVVQVNGKVRDVIKMSVVSCQLSEVVEKEALSSEKVKKHLEGHTYKVIFVPGKLINFVTS